jgi:hypothetical protein
VSENVIGNDEFVYSDADEGFGDARTVESEKLQVKSLSDFAVDEGPLMADLRPENMNNEAVLKKWYNNYQGGHTNGQQPPHGMQTGAGNYNHLPYPSHLHNHQNHQPHQQQQMNAPQPHASHIPGGHYNGAANTTAAGYRPHQGNQGHGNASQYGHNSYIGVNSTGGAYGGNHGGNSGKSGHANANQANHGSATNAYQGGNELFTSMLLGGGSGHNSNHGGYGNVGGHSAYTADSILGKRPSFSAGAIFDRVLSNADLFDDNHHFGSSLSSLFSTNNMAGHHGKSETATTASNAAGNSALDSGFVFPWGSPALNSLDLGGPGQGDVNGTNPFDPSFSFGNISSLDLPNVALKSNGSLLFPSMNSFPAFHDDSRTETDANDPFRGLTILQSASNMALDAMAAQAHLQSPTHSNQTNSSTTDSATKHHDFSNLDVNIYTNGGKGRGKHAKALSNSRATKALSSSSLVSMAPASSVPVSTSPTLAAGTSPSVDQKPKTASANILYGMIMGEDGVTAVAAAPASSTSSDNTVSSVKTDDSTVSSGGSVSEKSDKSSVHAGSVASVASIDTGDSSTVTVAENTVAGTEPHPDEIVSSDDHHVEVAVNDQGHHQVYQLPSHLDDSMDGGLTMDDDHHQHHNPSHNQTANHLNSPTKIDIAETKAGAGLTVVTATSPTRSFSNLSSIDASAFQKPATPTASVQNFMLVSQFF